MMNYYDEQLQKLQEQIARARQLEAMVAELCCQRDMVSAQVRELEKIKLDEQADVDRLEGGSLAAFFYNVIGKMDERLDQERAEAYAASVKYDAAVRELEGIERDLYRYESELGSLRGCQERYEKVMSEKAAVVKAAGGAKAEEIFRLEERFGYLESQKKELQEAVSAGWDAHHTAIQVLNSLGSAESWGTWDLFGGGMLTDMIKYSHMDSAQREIEHLQYQLSRFKTELADVTIYADMHMQVGEFLRFADYFFDNLFTDWAVLDQIRRSQSQVQHTVSQIEGVQNRLNTMMRNVDEEQSRIQEKLCQLVREAQI